MVSGRAAQRAGLVIAGLLLPGAESFLFGAPKPLPTARVGSQAAHAQRAEVPSPWARCLTKLQAVTAIAEAELSEVDKLSPPSTFFECTLQVRRPMTQLRGE